MGILRTFLCLFCLFGAPEIVARPPDAWAPYLLPASCSDWLMRSPAIREYRYLLGVHQVEGKIWREVLNVVEYDTDGPLLTTRYFRTVEQDYSPAGRPERAILPREAYLEKLRAIRIFANDKYRYRRPWPEAFLKSMEEETDALLGDTIASETVLKSTGTRVSSILFYLAPYGVVDGERVGEGHFVTKHYGPVAGFRERGGQSPAGSLPLPPAGIPETELLGITHPIPPELDAFLWRGEIPSALDVEIAAFVVEENLEILPMELRAEAWLECFLQLMLTAFDEDPRFFALYAKNFYVPADNRSQIMYRNILLQMQRAYFKDGHWVIVEPSQKTPAISAHDIDWRLMAFHPLSIRKFAQSVVLGTTSSLLPKFDSHAFLARAKQLGLRVYLPGSEFAAAPVHDTSLHPGDADDLTRRQLSDYLALVNEAVVHLAASEALEGASVGFTDRRKLTQDALEQVIQFAHHIGDQLPKWVLEQPEAVRTGIARMAMDLARVPKKCRGPLSSTFILQNSMLPLLVDPSGNVRFDSLYSLRFSFTRSSLLAAFGLDEASAEVRADELEPSLRADLRARGMTEEKIDWWVRQIRGFVPYTSIEAYQHWERASYSDMGDEMGVAPLLGNPDLMGKVLLLGVLRPAELGERAINLTPYEE